MVIFIHRPNLFKKKGEVTDEERAQTELIIAKQRNGPVDRMPFVFLGKYTRFEPPLRELGAATKVVTEKFLVAVPRMTMPPLASGLESNHRLSRKLAKEEFPRG